MSNSRIAGNPPATGRGQTDSTTVNDAVPVALPSVPVTVYVPGTTAEHELALHDAPTEEPEPSGAIVKVVSAVTSPVLSPPGSKPAALNDWDDPLNTVAVAGLKVKVEVCPMTTPTVKLWVTTGLRPFAALIVIG